MLKLNEIVTFERQPEHVLEHDLEHKKNFSTPKIYDAKGDLSKRWYIYFSFRNPETGKLQRMQNIYGKVNQYKTKEQRLAVLTTYRKNLIKLLKEGFNPFIDNSLLLNQQKTKSLNKSLDSLHKIEPNQKPKLQPELQPKQQLLKNNTNQNVELSLKEAFDFGLKLKEKVVSERTLKDYGYKTNMFLIWLKDNKPEVETINQLNKKVVLDFLNHILIKTSPRNRNNYRLDLSSILQTLEDNEVITTNFIKKINVLKSKPKRNKTYSLEDQEKIFNYLEDKDAILLLYIKFISFNLLRPIEVCRLKIGDINLKNNTLQFKAKNSPLKTKIIPEILLKSLPDLTKIDKTALLFTPTKIGDFWDAKETNRRDHFSKRFKTVVKDHFKLGEDYTLYSFRHTYITKLYRAILKESSPYEAKSKLMLITGHSSMSALEKYLRDIDAELPDDYSDMLK